MLKVNDEIYKRVQIAHIRFQARIMAPKTANPRPSSLYTELSDSFLLPTETTKKKKSSYLITK